MKKKVDVVVEMVEKPAHSFCEKCKNSDVRIYKDTLNALYLTVTQLADYFNFEGKIENKCKKINNWVRQQQNMEMKNGNKRTKIHG